MPGSRTETGLVKFQGIRGERGDTIVYFLLRRYCATIKRKTRVILYIKRERTRNRLAHFIYVLKRYSIYLYS